LIPSASRRDPALLGVLGGLGGSPKARSYFFRFAVRRIKRKTGRFRPASLSIQIQKKS
jgi:hypothetical protein